jgi:hypothetical protein
MVVFFYKMIFWGFGFIFVCLFVCFWDRVSLCGPGCRGTHFIDQAGLELRNPPASASRVLRLKVSWFPAFLWGLQLISWMNLRRALELWTLNIVETSIDYEDSESWTKCICIILCLSMAPKDSCFWTSLWGPGSGMWWFVYSWTTEWHHLEVWPCWNRCDLVGVGVSLWVWA